MATDDEYEKDLDSHDINGNACSCIIKMGIFFCRRRCLKDVLSCLFSELPASAAAGTNVAFLLHCRSSLAAILAMRSSASRYESLINLSNLIRVGKAGILTAQGWEIFTHLTGSTTEVCMKFVYKTSGYKTKSLIRQIGNGSI